MARTLIICPTHDHADTLFASIASVQAQRDPDWLLVVICDGAPKRTEEILIAFCAADPRISYRVRPKGERLGEAHRDPVIKENEAEFICYLGDDDLWRNDHLETMIQMLKDADFAMQATLDQGAGGTWSWSFVNLGAEVSQKMARMAEPKMVTAGMNSIAMRRDAYLRLPRGWSPAPAKMPSDVHMILEFMTTPGIRIASSAMVSFAKVPSRLARRDFTPERRLVDLTPILAKVNTPSYLEDAQSQAVLGKPLMRAFAYARVGRARNVDEACKLVGFRAVNPGGEPTTGVDGAPMDVPLTPSQRDQCEMAWSLLRSDTDPTAVKRLSKLAAEGLAWLLTPYLESLGEYDLAQSLRAAECLIKMADQAEIGSAYRLRALILDGQLNNAAKALDAAALTWPDAGWVKQMTGWLRNAQQKPR